MSCHNFPSRRNYRPVPSGLAEVEFWNLLTFFPQLSFFCTEFCSKKPFSHKTLKPQIHCILFIFGVFMLYIWKDDLNFFCSPKFPLPCGDSHPSWQSLVYCALLRVNWYTWNLYRWAIAEENWIQKPGPKEPLSCSSTSAVWHTLYKWCEFSSI